MKNLGFLVVVGILTVCTAGMAEEILWCVETPEYAECHGDYEYCSYWAEMEYAICMVGLASEAGPACIYQLDGLCYQECMGQAFSNWISGCTVNCVNNTCTYYCPPLNFEWGGCAASCTAGFDYFMHNCIAHYVGTRYHACETARDASLNACMCWEE